MLQAHRPNRPQRRIPVRWRTRARFALLSFVVVHGAGDIACAFDALFCWEHACGGEKESGCGGCAEIEGEGAVGADGYAGGDWGAGVVVGGAGVEFLGIWG